MSFRRYLSLSLLLFCVLLTGSSAWAQIPVVGDGGPGPVKAQHLTVEMVSMAPSIAPGGTLDVGLVITLEEKWHVYWINAGDSGEPPRIKWTLPHGITAGPMQFPVPTRLPLGPLMDFGYEDEVAFPVKLTAAKNLKPGPIHLDARVDWLVCREVCIPGKAHLGLNLTIDPKATAPAQPVGALGEALGLLPKPLPEGTKLKITGGKNEFVFDLMTGDRITDAEFYPFDTEQIANAGDQDVEPLSDGVRLRVPRAPELTKLPATLHGVIKLDDETSYEVNSPVVAGEIPRQAGRGAVPAGAKELTVLAAVSLAFFGGIILNLMPCVFPVLFLKGLSLVQSSNEERGRIRRHGLVYTLGILVSFWVIVAALLILRAGGNEAGWGFQLQSPTFLAILSSAIFFFALSLSGLFDIGLSLTSVGGGLAQKQGYTGSFFTGVLATVVATPCTAPFMGAAIGFALAQSGWITFGVFTALALGLAAPYLLLSFQPAWTRLLPRPGAWMEVFKQVTAIIFFGTVIWLAYVYGNLYGSEQGVYHVALLLTCFLLLTIAGWVLGKWPARWSSSIVAVLIAIFALAVPLYQPKQTTLTWQPYSEQALNQARAEGKPVFIDFTAAWCLSCQVNERLVLRSADVQHEFAKNKVLLLKADWTKYDAEITKQLASVGRSGVPTYVIYPVGKGAADVLPELLTKDIVLTALKKDTSHESE
ncbi:protein-disulfide reductase DsbD family protein [Edaphobacter albus]|uniref:protein-disulfide reductase DsbD family protein n=1 Tax=Edaphobacter sp. 4G125 TaxID=2763071 RepID=UPI001644A0B9|nr:thioredoxin family protein [Edaphobacter sp. 4G125]QNI38071.1 thioredoxin family protein [Edaphobacter sp. 4G125]